MLNIAKAHSSLAQKNFSPSKVFWIRIDEIADVSHADHVTRILVIQKLQAYIHRLLLLSKLWMKSAGAWYFNRLR